MFRAHAISLGSRMAPLFNPFAPFPTLLKAYGSDGQAAFSTTFHDGKAPLLGELVERQHFFSCINTDAKGTIEDYCSPAFCKSFRHLVHLEPHQKLSPAVNRLIRHFSKNGSLYVANTSRLFSCYTIQIVFIAHAQRAHVRFSIGGACALNPRRALEKALLEMTQSFTMMAECHDRRDPERYTREKAKHERLVQNFTQCNTREMYNHFPYLYNGEPPVLTMEEYFAQPSIKLRQVTKELEKISPLVFYKGDTLFVERDFVCFGRIVSPDFFVAMDNSPPFNVHNAFSKAMGISKNKDMPVPFG